MSYPHETVSELVRLYFVAQAARNLNQATVVSLPNQESSSIKQVYDSWYDVLGLDRDTPGLNRKPPTGGNLMVDGFDNYKEAEVKLPGKKR